MQVRNLLRIVLPTDWPPAILNLYYIGNINSIIPIIKYSWNQRIYHIYYTISAIRWNTNLGAKKVPYFCWRALQPEYFMGIYPKMPMELSSSDDNRRIQRPRLYVVDSMFSAFRMSPAASSGQCDNDRALFRVTLSRVRKLGSPCTTKINR